VLLELGWFWYELGLLSLVLKCVLNDSALISHELGLFSHDLKRVARFSAPVARLGTVLARFNTFVARFRTFATLSRMLLAGAIAIGLILQKQRISL
jgi:hypothetical protein